MKDLANNGYLPRWVKMIGYGVLIGVNAAAIWYSMLGASEKRDTRLAYEMQGVRYEIRHWAEQDSIRAAATIAHVMVVEKKIHGLVRDSNTIHRDIWDVIGTPRRHRDLED